VSTFSIFRSLKWIWHWSCDSFA